MAVQLLGRSEVGPQLGLPLFVEGETLGEAATLENQTGVDLNTLCLRRPDASFFVAMETDAMVEAGIEPGDVLIAERTDQARSGQVIVATFQGELTIRTLQLTPSPRLLPGNPGYEAILIPDNETLTIVGVVTQVVHPLR